MLFVGYSDIKDLNTELDLLNIFDNNRLDYINTISDSNRKKQSYYAWILLGRILSNLNIDIKNYKFKMLENGKWVCENNQFNFNISHSKNIICVIVSMFGDCSIDVEMCQERIVDIISKYQPKFKLKMSNIIHCTKLWTLKEISVKGNYRHIKSKKIVDAENNKYVLSFSYNEKQKIKLKKIIL